jgi:hypothetical protein
VGQGSERSVGAGDLPDPHGCITLPVKRSASASEIPFPGKLQDCLGVIAHHYLENIGVGKLLKERRRASGMLPEKWEVFLDRKKYEPIQVVKGATPSHSL